jgi:hypothetical protein
MFELHLGMSEVERVSFDELLEHMSVLERILTDKAGLERAEAAGAVLGFDPAATEKGAKWLRSELRRLRHAQEIGRHPSRRAATLSLLEISAAAFNVVRVQSCLGDELLSLLLELLNLHRQSPDVFKTNSDLPFLKRAGISDLEDTRSSKRLARLRGIRKYPYCVDILEGTLSYGEVTEIAILFPDHGRLPMWCPKHWVSPFLAASPCGSGRPFWRWLFVHCRDGCRRS